MDSQARSRVLPAAARPRSSRGEFSVLGLFHTLSLACACPSPQSRLHGRTFKFAERVRRNPPGGGRVLPANPCGCAGGFAVQSQIPFTDVPQGPVDGLSHEIAVIVRLSLDQRQHSPKLRVGRLLVPIRQVSHQCKPRPLDELWAAPAPGHRFPPCRSSEHEEMATRAVANVPIIEIAHPSFHLLRGTLPRQIDHTRQNPRIMDAAGPQFERQLMIFPDAAGQFIHFWLRHAVDDFRAEDRKSTRLNSSHGYISYAVFCLKKKKQT